MCFETLQNITCNAQILRYKFLDVENLPRDKSFFFNRNRLNVAVSRGQCSSIVLLNPQLLEAPPKTLEEFKMINNFNKLLKYKTKTNQNLINFKL